jgi:hypothetical protein
VWTETNLVACASGLETVTTTIIFSIKQTHELRSSIPVVVLDITALYMSGSHNEVDIWYIRTECTRLNVPSWAGDQQISEGCSRCLGLGCEYAED